MATRTKSPTSTIFVATLAAVLATAQVVAEIRGASSDSGEPRDLVNRPDCRADGANSWDRCIFR